MCIGVVAEVATTQVKGALTKRLYQNDCIGILVGQYQMRRRVIYFCRHDEAGVIRQSARRNWIEIFRRGQICRM